MKNEPLTDARNHKRSIILEVEAQRMSCPPGTVFTAGHGDFTRIIGPGGYGCIHLDDEAKDGWTVWDRYDPHGVVADARTIARGVTFDEAVVMVATRSR